ncbi:MAG: hypothetical protein WDW36_005017 [Sanguina aurantia]
MVLPPPSCRALPRSAVPPPPSLLLLLLLLFPQAVLPLPPAVPGAARVPTTRAPAAQKLAVSPRKCDRSPGARGPKLTPKLGCSGISTTLGLSQGLHVTRATTPCPDGGKAGVRRALSPQDGFVPRRLQLTRPRSVWDFPPPPPPCVVCPCWVPQDAAQAAVASGEGGREGSGGWAAAEQRGWRDERVWVTVGLFLGMQCAVGLGLTVHIHEWQL